jgi:LPS O-antigen subunit length determinant protein (WzzB/FepE family)
MKKNNKNINDYEIDLSALLRKFWEEKFLILSISVMFVIAGFFYSYLTPKVYKTEINIREANKSSFEFLRPVFVLEGSTFSEINKTLEQITDEFNNEFKIQLSSFNNLAQFYSTTNNSAKHSIKNISVKINPINEKQDLKSTFIVSFKTPLLEDRFFTDYIVYAQQKALTKNLNNIEKRIIGLIYFYKINLNIAKQVDLNKDTFHLAQLNSNRISSELLFNRGTTVLIEQIVLLEDNLKLVKKMNLNIVDYSEYKVENINKLSVVTKSTIYYISVAFVLGFFLSLIIVVIKDLNKKIS